MFENWCGDSEQLSFAKRFFHATGLPLSFVLTILTLVLIFVYTAFVM